VAITSLAKKPPERRPNRRQRVLLSGLVAYAHGAHCFHCTIRNLNAVGARVSLPKRHAVPSKFYLINLHGQMAYDCKLVWNNGVEAGVAFTQALPLDKLTDPKLHFLRRLGSAYATASIVRME
jgi:hypothetical protein